MKKDINQRRCHSKEFTEVIRYIPKIKTPSLYDTDAENPLDFYENYDEILEEDILGTTAKMELETTPMGN